MSLWEKLFEKQIDTKTTDSTQVINKTLNKLSDIVKSYKVDKSIKNIDEKNIDIINIIEISFDLCCLHINNYFDLPYTYDGDNYVLNRIMDIFEHIVCNTLMVNLYHIIEKIIRTELTYNTPQLSGQSQIEYEKELDKKVKEIISSSVNDINIKKYLFEIMPQKIIKIVLNIYENEEDDDKKINLLNVFDFIIKILETNTILIINKEHSKIITTLETYVFPYFKEYIDTTIITMKKFTDGYLSMIINISSKLKTFKLIMNKAKLEK